MSEPSEDRLAADACPVTTDAVLERIAELRATSEQIRAALDLQCEVARGRRDEREANYREFAVRLAAFQASMRSLSRRMNKQALRDLALALLFFLCALVGAFGMLTQLWRST